MKVLSVHYLGGIIKDYDAYMRHQKRLSVHTIKAYHHDVQDFLSFLSQHSGGDVDLSCLERITLRDCRSWLASRYEHFDEASNARAVVSVRHFWRYLMAQNLLQSDVFFLLKTPKRKKTLPRPLSSDETDFLLHNVDVLSKSHWVGLRDKALVWLLYGTGLRISEALQLSQGMIPKSPMSASMNLRILGKGGRERMVPMLKDVHEKIIHYIYSCPYQGEALPLFLGLRGKPLQATAAAKVLRDFRRLYDFPETLTPHALRHTCATHLMKTSKDLRGIQTLLGHKSLNSTQIYTGLDMETLVKTYQKAHPRKQGS